MTDYQKYINALRKCAKEHENDRTFTGHIIVSDLCRDTANLLEILEQEPCDDAINRQAVLDEAFEIDTKEYGRIEVVGVDAINSLMPVTPQEPRKGHWIEYSWNDNGLARWGLECDKCHKKYKYGGEIWNNPNYCPNCGAKMKKGK